MVDSTFAPAYRELGDIYFRANQFKNAAAQYKRYLDLNNNCSARIRYSGFLNQTKEYQQSLDAAKEALKCDTTDAFLYRYMAYDYLALKDCQKGLSAIRSFFQKSKPEKIIPLDYETRAKLYAMCNSDSLAIPDFKKALEMDTTKKELNADMVNSLLKMKRYPEVIEILKKRTANGKGNFNDYYGLAKAYYYTKDFVSSDSAAAAMIRMKPELTYGYAWRAKANVQLDPKNEKWAAKEFYEAFIAHVKPEDTTANKGGLIDAYTYLAAYSASNKNCPDTKGYFEKVLALDPNNAQAKKFMAAPCK
jgi:predicted Zn-dependent protease